MNYKLNKLICSVAIVSTIMPLSACQNNNKMINLSRKNEISYLINPLDWNKTPDYVNLKIKDNYITMDIDTFYRLLNKDDKDFILKLRDEQITLDKQILRKKIEQEFIDYISPSTEDYIKIIIMIVEGTILLIIENKVITLLAKPKEKIKKLS